MNLPGAEVVRRDLDFARFKPLFERMSRFEVERKIKILSLTLYLI